MTTAAITTDALTAIEMQANTASGASTAQARMGLRGSPDVPSKPQGLVRDLPPAGAAGDVSAFEPRPTHREKKVQREVFMANPHKIVTTPRHTA